VDLLVRNFVEISRVISQMKRENRRTHGHDLPIAPLFYELMICRSSVCVKILRWARF